MINWSRNFVCPRCGTAVGESTEFADAMDAIEGYCPTCEDWTRPGSLPHHYDYDGNPIPGKHWAFLFEERKPGDAAGRWRVGLDHVGDYEISTVWMGLDHSFGQGLPLIYETMVFGGGQGADCGEWMERYPTRAEASAGHQKWIEWARERTALGEQLGTTWSAEDVNDPEFGKRENGEAKR